MKTMLHVGLMLLMLLTSCRSQNATTELTVDAWRGDLSYLARELPSRHANAFHTASRESFDAEVTRLDAAIPRMSRDEIMVGLMRIVALIGDGHTHLDLPPSFLRYPIELQWFGDELRIVAAAAPYHEEVGARVIAIGSTPVRDVMDRATQLVPRDLFSLPRSVGNGKTIPLACTAAPRLMMRGSRVRLFLLAV